MNIVVVGSGIAGLTAALEASERHEVTLITKAELAESNTRYAQGGIAAVMFDDDSVENHVADTIAAGAGLCNPEAVRVLCEEGPERVRDLIQRGVEFDRANGEFARGLEAAHSHARVLHAGGDATGAAVELALVAAVRAAGIRVLEHHFLADLVLADSSGRSVGNSGQSPVSRFSSRVSGVSVITASGEVLNFRADAVILASGGAGQLYRHTTNPVVATGDGAAAAIRAGAVMADVEFYQFHPTSLAIPGNFLISEAVRGERAVLRAADGTRFLADVHPLAELAPRDVVARGIAAQMEKQPGQPVLLDATALGAEFLSERFPSISRACAANGLDWARVPIPVTPAAHYWMGGIRTDLWGRTSVPGLFAVGEVAATGVHGANRLASNSLLESLVFASRGASARWRSGRRRRRVRRGRLGRRGRRDPAERVLAERAVARRGPPRRQPRRQPRNDPRNQPRNHVGNSGQSSRERFLSRRAAAAHVVASRVASQPQGAGGGGIRSGVLARIGGHDRRSGGVQPSRRRPSDHGRRARPRRVGWRALPNRLS